MRKLLIALPVLLISCQPAVHALEDKQAVKCLLGEAEGEKDMTATAEALRNRIALMGENKALRGVYGCKAVSESSGVFKRGKRTIPDYAVKRAVKAWEASKASNLTKGGTHWEAVETFGNPKWAYKLTKTAKVGQHTFYK